jgi:hypothetical protein
MKRSITVLSVIYSPDRNIMLHGSQNRFFIKSQQKRCLQVFTAHLRTGRLEKISVEGSKL